MRWSARPRNWTFCSWKTRLSCLLVTILLSFDNISVTFAADSLVLDNEEIAAAINSPNTVWFRTEPEQLPGGIRHKLKVAKFAHGPSSPNGWVKGAMVGEILWLDDEQHIWQVRVQQRTSNGWTFFVFQPFLDLEELNNALEEVGYTPLPAETKVLPDLPVAELLKNRVYQDVFGSLWALPTNSKKSIVPFDHNAQTVNDCRRCHPNGPISIKFDDFRRLMTNDR